MSFEGRFAKKTLHCERIIGYAFENKALCAEALNAAADMMAVYRDGFSARKLPKNDRLAVYGGAVAATALCRDWYASGSEKGENSYLDTIHSFRVLTSCSGAWTTIRNNALGNNFLAQKGFANGLDGCVTCNNGTPSISEKMMATAMEGILGAVHLDGGDEALKQVMEHLQIGA